MKIKKSDKIAWIFGILVCLSLILLIYDYILIWVISIIVFLILFLIFVEPEIKKEKVNDVEELTHSPEEVCK
ncbi:MAG: hypothetical protein AABY22_03715 [Nanoarchaeota archaeon]